MSANWVSASQPPANLLDFVTIEDGFSVQSTRTDQVAGRLDAGYGPWVRSIRTGEGAIP